ncbi:MAG: hypothetical protein MUC40_05560 [Akkermansiaceae bacterium]|nr:hypothetical protein [Akkermansiaceae bacterium]
MGSAPGINLGELWVDHNVWAELEYPSPAPQHADGGVIPSGMPFLVCNDRKSDPFLLYKHLPRLQLTLLYSLISKSRMANGKKVYDLFLVADPVFTIWNPFDVCLHVPKSAFATFKSWAIPYDLNLNLENGPQGSRTSFTRSIKQLSNDRLFFFYGQLGRGQNLVLRPGEVQVIAQGFGDTIRNPGKGSWQFDGKLGWEFASGYAYPIPYETNPDMMNGSQKITYSMTPNAIKSDAGMFLWSYNIGELVDSSGTTKYVGSFNIDLVYSRLQDETPISANAFPNIFPSLPRDPSAANTIAQLENNKWPICVFTYGLRTESDPLFAGNQNPGTRFTGRAMLRANDTSVAQDLYNLDPDIVRASPLQVGMRRVNSLNDRIVDCDASGLGYYGAEYWADGGVSYVITRSVPRVPIHSLGALQHGAAEGAKFGQARGERSWFLQPSISHAISNSFAPSFIGPGEVRGQLANRPAADHSYLVNLALWDDYFHSSVTPRTTSAHRNSATAWSEQKERLEKFLAIGNNNFEPLPNERMRPWTSDPLQTLRAIFPSNNPAPDAARRIASNLMVDGMFNVNSTSVEAWKGFLSGLKGAKVPVSATPGLDTNPKLVDTKETPVPSLLLPGAGKIDENTLGDTADPDQWLGFRTLSDEQIEELAEAVVKQVRLRGPFLSIADFINRRPGNDKDLALSGPLQSALDDKDVSINEAFRQGQRGLGVAEAADQGHPFPEAEAGAKAVGAPGYVKQGDLLTPLGPLVNVRGDTFVVRAYGDARDPSGTKILARAWCEAVVQRVPDYVDPRVRAPLQNGLLPFPECAGNPLKPRATSRIFPITPMHRLLSRTLVPAICLAGSLCLAQEPGVAGVRALLLVPGGPVTTLYPLSGKLAGNAVQIGARGLSESFKPVTREFSLAARDTTQESGYRPVAKVSLPPQGGDFIILLEPAGATYKVHVVNGREARFGADSVLFFNATENNLGASLGDNKFIIKPRAAVFAKPPPRGEKPFYQVTFYQPKDGKARPFANTRWPHRDASRCYVFLYRNQATGRLTYQAVDERLTPVAAVE